MIERDCRTTRNFRLWHKLTFYGYDVNIFLACMVILQDPAAIGCSTPTHNIISHRPRFVGVAIQIVGGLLELIGLTLIDFYHHFL